MPRKPRDAHTLARYLEQCESSTGVKRHAVPRYIELAIVELRRRRVHNKA